MKAPVRPENELQRLAALRASGLLDSPAEERFDRLTRLARQLFQVETVLISLLDEQRQWFKSKEGANVCETSRDISLCGHAILDDEIFEIPDTLQDERFKDNPLVTGPPYIRFYAAKPVQTASGFKLGTFCIFDPNPRTLKPEERTALRDFAASVENEIRATSNLVRIKVPRSPIDRRAPVTSRVSAQGGGVQSARVQAVLDHIVDGILIIEPDGRIDSANRAAIQMFGFRRDELIGKSIGLLLPNTPSTDTTPAGKEAEHWIGRNIGFRREVCAQARAGQSLDTELVVSEYRRGHHHQYICMLRDISARKAHEQQINSFAFYDTLTQLPNRRLLHDRLEHARVANRRLNSHGALLFIDLDQFKKLNDTAGHHTGDMLLQKAADRIKSCVRDSDTVSRWGGDEFVVVLENLGEDPASAAAFTEMMSEKIRCQLNKPYELGEFGEVSYCSSPSTGAVLFYDEEKPLEELLKQADLAMYQAKAAGGNRTVFFDPAMDAAVKARSEMEQQLREALQQQNFTLFYQVQVDADDRPTGAEALLRWQHPEMGIVLPASFLPLAEKSHLILPLGQWVLQSACTQLALWADQPHLAHLTLSINISPSQISDPNFEDIVNTALDSTGANARRLKLEISEPMHEAEIPAIRSKMIALESRGIQFALDHYGAGYSAPAHLKQLPIEQLKIDRLLVHELADAHSDVSLSRAIIALADNLGYKVIAEGVETRAHQDILAGIGCQAYQGFLYGSPMPADEFERALTPSPGGRTSINPSL
ncbi:MAG: hypothetical protein CME36_20180 [unclassified Hahellaceae]|nr:hypothetical protein [Hahellaceae bacterium]|tara:strand:- start:33985 stop:36279 length:2295 start_codon:yes stop_codon:yes gene_type:complete